MIDLNAVRQRWETFKRWHPKVGSRLFLQIVHDDLPMLCREIERLQGECDLLRTEATDLRPRTAEAEQRLLEQQTTILDLQRDLAAEREAHAVTNAYLDRLRRETEALLKTVPSEVVLQLVLSNPK